MRAFIAIMAPEIMKQQITVLQKEIRDSSSAARLTAFHQLHMTIAFIPDLSFRQKEAFASRFSAVELFSPAVECSSLSSMHARNGRLYYLSVRPNPEIDLITDTVRDMLDALGIKYERRAVKYHITIARRVERFHQQSTPLPDPAHARELTLFTSELTPRGAVHTPVASIYLKPLGTVI